MDISSISAVLGILGGYFAILLVLSVSVESILETFTFFKGLQKQANPDDVLKDVQEWLPEGSGEAAKVMAIQSYAERAKVDLAELDRTALEVTARAIETLKQLGLEEQAFIAKKEIAIKLAILRERYAASQKQRITILRTLSAVIGIILAFLLNINTFDMLGSVFSPNVIDTFNTPMGFYGGVIVTGLAASAGSSFWHDMIGRARNLKEVIKSVESLQ